MKLKHGHVTLPEYLFWSWELELWVLWHQFGAFPTATGSHEVWTLGARLFTWRALKIHLLELGQLETNNIVGGSPSAGVFTGVWSDSVCGQHWEAQRSLDSWLGSCMKFKTWDLKSIQIKLSHMFTLYASRHPSEAR